MHAPVLRRLRTVDSTNAEAIRLVRAGETPPFWVVSDEQTGGKGRRGRLWVSKPGNLYASYVGVIPHGIDDYSGYVLASSLAVRAAIASAVEGKICSKELTLKWPNDVEYRGCKLSGILLETVSLRTTRPDHVVIGCGINCAHAPDLEDRATGSIASLGGDVDLEKLHAALDQGLDHHISLWRDSGSRALRQCWLEHATGIGQAVTVRLPDRSFDAIFEGLDEAGCLIARLKSGERELVAAGDVFFGP